MSKLRWMRIVMVGLLACGGCTNGSLNGSPRDVSAGAIVPEITAFSALTTSGIAGDSIVLTWEAVGDQATLCPIIDAHWVSCRCLFDVPLIGSQVIAPQDIVGRYSAFELAADAADLRITRTVTLNVSCSPGTPSWFFADPPQMCPDELAVHSLAAAQRFEHGLMIWLAEQDTYYILYDYLLPPSEGTVVSATITSVQIIRGPLDLEPGASPANRVGEDPPAEYTEPVSGFGLVWRGEVQGVQGIRERLGWALAEEVSYMSAYQCEPACGSHWNCYLLGPDGTVFHLSYNAHLGYLWQIWGQMED